jgi:hypothetical protein
MKLFDHKTKLVGVVSIICGTLQASGQLQSLLSPDQYGWLTIVLGVGTAVCGFLNSAQAKESKDDNQVAG